MNPLESLKQNLLYIHEAISQKDCLQKLDQLGQEKSYNVIVLNWFSRDPLKKTTLRAIEDSFQKQVLELNDSLKKFEIYLKRQCEKNIVVANDFLQARQHVLTFYQAMHPFLMLLKRHKQKSLPPLEKKNMDDLFSCLKECEKPFYFPEIDILYRCKAIIALEGLYQGSLPYSFLKKIARNYEILWKKKQEGTLYQEKIRAVMYRIDSKVDDERKMHVVIRGFQALVEHFNQHHHVNDTEKASLKGLELAFFVAGAGFEHRWIGQFDADQIKWRETLKKGSVVHFRKQPVKLSTQLKRGSDTQKKDKNLIFECEDLKDCLVMIPQNRAMFGILELLRNTTIPLFKIHEVEPKQRYALIERLYPLRVGDENIDKVIKQFDQETQNNKQPSTFDKEFLKFNQKGEFRSLTKGEIISLDREKLEELFLILASNEPQRYLAYVKKSITMNKLHVLCINIIKVTLGLEKYSLETLLITHAISFIDDCIKFQVKIKKFKEEVRQALLKEYDLDFLERQDTKIAKAILYCYEELKTCGLFNLEAREIVRDHFKKLISKNSAY